MDGCVEPIETQIYEPNPERPGYLKLVRDRTIGEVWDDLRRSFGELPEGADEYWGPMVGVDLTDPWPQGRIVVYAVVGGSEGYYTHVEVQGISGVRDLILLGKTLGDRDSAWYHAKRVAERLGA